MHIPTLYLDSSVIGGYFDEQFKEATQELWKQAENGLYKFRVSILVADEMENAPKQVQELFQKTFAEEDSLFNFDQEMDNLAKLYLRQGVVTQKYAEDAGHVAACTVARIDYLVSWNFKHLVNVRREAGFNAVNLLQGHPSVRILSPLELIYGSQEKEV